MRFNDQQYLDDYLTWGEFPKIHDDIYYHTIKHCKDKHVNVLDFGSCTGLLSLRLGKFYDNVIGLEPSVQDYDRSIRTAKNVDYINTRITPFSLDIMLDKFKSNLIVARRVFPEISEGSHETMSEIARIITKYKVKHISIEGRKESINSRHILSNVNKECEYFKGYNILSSYKNCVILEYNEII